MTFAQCLLQYFLDKNLLSTTTTRSPRLDKGHSAFLVTPVLEKSLMLLCDFIVPISAMTTLLSLMTIRPRTAHFDRSALILHPHFLNRLVAGVATGGIPSVHFAIFGGVGDGAETVFEVVGVGAWGALLELVAAHVTAGILLHRTLELQARMTFTHRPMRLLQQTANQRRTFSL